MLAYSKGKMNIYIPETITKQVQCVLKNGFLPMMYEHLQIRINH